MAQSVEHRGSLCALGNGHRPDDALEILACYLAIGAGPILDALKKGLGMAPARCDEYQIAKVPPRLGGTEAR